MLPNENIIKILDCNGDLKTIHITKEEFKSVFMAIRKDLRPHHLAMLNLNYNAPDSVITATEMAEGMGYATFAAANLQYGKLADILCSYFNVNPVYKVAILVSFCTVEYEDGRSEVSSH